MTVLLWEGICIRPMYESGLGESCGLSDSNELFKANLPGHSVAVVEMASMTLADAKHVFWEILGITKRWIPKNAADAFNPSPCYQNDVAPQWVRRLPLRTLSHQVNDRPDAIASIANLNPSTLSLMHCIDWSVNWLKLCASAWPHVIGTGRIVIMGNLYLHCKIRHHSLWRAAG